MHHCRDVVTYWSKIAKNLPHSHLVRSLWVTPCEFFDDHTFPEIRIMGLSDGVHFMTPLSLCWAQYRPACDGHTDRHLTVAKTALCIALLG